MSYILEKSYIERLYEGFHKEIGVKEDLSFTYYVMGVLFEELDMYNIDDDIIVDGSGDKQIDVVYINKQRNEINIIQVKKSNGRFSSNVVIQMSNGLEWFFKDKEEVNQLKNLKLKEKIFETRENDLIDWQSVKINVYYCNLADSLQLPHEVEEEVKSINSKFKEIYPGFNFKIIGVSDLYKMIKNNEDRNIDDVIDQYDNNSVIRLDLNDDTKSLVLRVSTKKIAELVNKYGDNLFEQNIRYSLGDNKVNSKIYETCTGNDSELFWYYNNGITIICDSFTEVNHPNKASVKLNNLQIVNGCQTSTTLHKAFIENKLKDSYVLVKIYSSKDEEFISKITEATNSQNSINSRDLAANEKLQVLIDDNFQKIGYSYERKRNQYKGKKIDISKKINNEKLGQAVMSIIFKKPSKARGNKSSSFSNEFYNNIFDRTIEQLLLCYLIFDFCEKKRKLVKLSDDIKTQITNYGTFHIARLMGELLFDDGVFSNNKDILHKLIDEYLHNIDIFEESYLKSIDILENIIDLQKEENEIYSLTNFFKRTETERLINIEMKK